MNLSKYLYKEYTFEMWDFLVASEDIFNYRGFEYMLDRLTETYRVRIPRWNFILRYKVYRFMKEKEKINE